MTPPPENCDRYDECSKKLDRLFKLVDLLLAEIRGDLDHPGIRQELLMHDNRLATLEKESSVSTARRSTVLWYVLGFFSAAVVQVLGVLAGAWFFGGP